MNKIPRKDLERIMEAASEVASALDEVDAILERARGDVAAVMAEAAAAQETVRELLEDAASVAEEYLEGRSDAWHDSERGQAHTEWVQQLRLMADAAAEDLEAPAMEDPERPDWIGEAAEGGSFAEFEF